MSRRATVLLFDIDGTIMTQKGVSRRAANAAFQKVHGRDAALDAIPFAGRTDPLIFGDGLRSLGVDVTEQALEAIYEAYLSILPGYMQVDPHVALLPGIRELLAAVRGLENVEVGLGTGNIVAGAKLKVGHFGLWESFDFGGFGSDHSDRPTLIGVGADRGAARLGRPRTECRVIIIGDTPHDVTAAKANGAECLGVLTGGDTEADLLAVGAELVVPDLTHPQALAFLLGSGSALP